MENQRIVDGLIGYFKGDQWRRMVAALTQDPDPHNTHAHIYVEMSVDPAAVDRLIVGYFEARGYPNARRIDWLAPKPEVEGSLHGVEPKGLAHYDFNWFYNPDVVLAPTSGGEKGESGCNLCIWNKAYMQEYYADFPFRQVGPAEEEMIRKYFRSEHWHKGLEWATKPNVTHTHINVYSSVHPDILKKFAAESIAEEGWEIYYTCPNVYLVDGKYTGKLVHMGKNPEAVYDLGWRFNPNVIIEPAMDNWNIPGTPGYDILTTDDNKAILSHSYVAVTDSEIQAVLDAVAPSK
ncbi:MAG: hypothetical protein ACYC66_12875 [Chloroflexota bacterium]